MIKEKNKKVFAKYKDNLITAYFHQYTVNLPQSKLNEIQKAVEDETGIPSNTNFSCGRCILNLLKQAARLYFLDCIEELPEDLQKRFKI